MIPKCIVHSSDKLEYIQRAAARMVKYLIVTHVIRGKNKHLKEDRRKIPSRKRKTACLMKRL